MPRSAAVLPSAHRLALVVSLVGIGCLQPTTERQGDSVPLNEWCLDSLDDLFCSPQIACGQADPDAGCANIGANSRLASVSDPCSPALLAAIDAGTVRYDGQAAFRCHHEALTQCEDTAPARTDCAAIFIGSGAVATPCSFDAQCAPGLWCSFEAAVCPGACTARVGRGEVVAVPVACSTEFAQPLDGGTFVCVDRSLEGQPCGWFCAPGLHCDDQTQLCAANLAVGAACTPDQWCAVGASCVDGHCARFARRGAPCAPQFFATDPTLAPCQLGLASRAGVCGDALRAGESCREDSNRCAANLRCDLSGTETCDPLAPAGAGCTSDFECVPPLRCNSGLCREPGGLGQSCSAAASCAATLRCLDGQCVSSARECR